MEPKDCDASEAIDDRLPDGWRYVEEEQRYAKAIREDYHPDGRQRTIVLVALRDGGWRVGAKRGFGDRLTIDRETHSEAVDAFVEVAQLEEASKIVRESYPPNERSGWFALIEARLRALEASGFDGGDEDRPDPSEQAELESFTRASEIEA